LLANVTGWTLTRLKSVSGRQPNYVRGDVLYRQLEQRTHRIDYIIRKDYISTCTRAYIRTWPRARVLTYAHNHTHLCLHTYMTTHTSAYICDAPPVLTYANDHAHLCFRSHISMSTYLLVTPQCHSC
jgi:hypothetical protein